MPFFIPYSILIPPFLFIIILGISISSHLLHGSYTWKFNRPHFYLLQRFYMRYEYMLMRFLLALSKTWIIRNSKILRMFITRILTLLVNAEIYTLDECLKIVDSLYKDFPNVNVGIRICPCRQARREYDDTLSNITDLTFIYSMTPGIKKHFQFTKFINLNQAKDLLKKFDKEGYVHTMFGNCAQLIDGGFSVAICNCRRNVCIPIDVGLDLKLQTLIYNKPHNLAVINQKKCKGAKECGICLEMCNFEARVVDINNGKIRIINEKCYGCALCAHYCPEGANQVKFLPKNKVYFYQNLFKTIKTKYS